MRRTLVLLALAAAVAFLVVVIEPPTRPPARERVSGPRVFRVPAAAVTAVEVEVRGERIQAVREGAGWVVDGTAAGRGLARALDDLVHLLVTTRAVDRFRDPRDAPFGLDAPSGRVALRTPDRRTVIVLGSPNAARSAIYARRPGSPRVLILGIYLLSGADRVFYQRQVERGDDGGGVGATDQRPETG